MQQGHRLSALERGHTLPLGVGLHPDSHPQIDQIPPREPVHTPAELEQPLYAVRQADPARARSGGGHREEGQQQGRHEHPACVL